MNVKFDRATGVRTWTPDKGAPCAHGPEEGEPLSYMAWHGWAERHAKTHGQRKCKTPGCPIMRWYPK